MTKPSQKLLCWNCGKEDECVLDSQKRPWCERCCAAVQREHRERAAMAIAILQDLSYHDLAGAVAARVEALSWRGMEGS